MAYNNVKVKARQTVVQSNTQTKDLGTVSEVPMGVWNADIPYKKLNLVRYNGATYIATQDNQGATPTGSGIWLLVNKDGRGVTDTAITYQAGISGATPPTGEWVSEVPTVPQGQYLWTRVIYAFTDNTQTVAYSISLQGLNFTQQDRNDIDRITDAIPSTASADNPLATHDFVNSSINAMAAFYVEYNAQGDAFPTRAALLNATVFYNAGQPRIPTQNDYAYVLSDESQPKDSLGNYPTTRYSYQGGTYPNGQWGFQYIVNNTSLTQAQVDAINSGITKDIVNQIGKGDVTGVKGNSEADYRQGNVNLKSSDIGSVARDTFFTAQSQTVGSYVKVFKSGIATYEWDTISMVFVISDKNANNIKIGSAGYRVTYQMRGTNTPLFEIERLFGNEEPDIRLYINYNNSAYQADRNYFEIYWKVGYGADDAKIFQVINYSNRSGGINDFEQYTGYLTAEETPTSLGAFNSFKTYVTTAFLEKSGGTMTGRLNLNADGVYVNDGVNNQQVVWAKDDGDSGNYGCELFVEGRGNTFVGAGESPHSLNNELRAGNLKTGEQYGRAAENLYISSDSNIFFNPNCNTIGNRGVIRLDSGALSMYSPNLNKWVRMCDDRLDISAAPAANQYNGLEIFDKNNNYVSNFRFMNATGYKATQMTIRSGVDGTLRQAGVEVAINNDGTSRFRPYENNATDLGDSSHRWKGVYANKFYGSLNLSHTQIYGADPVSTGRKTVTNMADASFISVEFSRDDGLHFQYYISYSEFKSKFIDTRNNSVVFQTSDMWARLQYINDTTINILGKSRVSAMWIGKIRNV